MNAPVEEGGRRATRERILEAALGVAGDEGLEALTTRRVAQAAGVNVGLLHYYFESKERLVDETLQRFVAEMVARAAPEVEPDPDREPEQILVEMLSSAMRLAAQRPGLIFGLVGKLVAAISLLARSEEARNLELAELPPLPFGVMAKAQERLFKRLRPLLAARLGDDPELIGIRSIQIFTSIFHPVLFTPFPTLVFGVDLRDEEGKRRYIKSVVRDALSPPTQK